MKQSREPVPVSVKLLFLKLPDGRYRMSGRTRPVRSFPERIRVGGRTYYAGSTEHNDTGCYCHYVRRRNSQYQ